MATLESPGREFPALPGNSKDVKICAPSATGGCSGVRTDDSVGRYFGGSIGSAVCCACAKAKTTCEWTGLTSYQLLTMVRRGFDLPKTRGPATQFLPGLFDSKKRRAEAGGGSVRQLWRTPGYARATGKRNCRAATELEMARESCEALEACREWHQLTLTFEPRVMLARGAVEAELITVASLPKTAKGRCWSEGGSNKQRTAACATRERRDLFLAGSRQRMT